MKKLFLILKRWYSDKELVVLSGKETFVLILIFSACFLFLTVQSAVYRHRRDQNFQEIQKRIDANKAVIDANKAMIDANKAMSMEILENQHRRDRETKRLHKKKSK